MEKILIHQFREKLELRGYSQRVIQDYPEYVRLFLEYLEEKENLLSMDELTQEHITGYHTYVQYSKVYHGKYLTTPTVRTRLQTVKTFFTIMYEEGILTHDYTAMITLPKRKQSLPKHILSVKEMNHLLESVNPVNALTSRDRTILELLYATGIRSDELRSLTLDSVDFVDKTVFVTGKGSKDRIVPLGEWVLPFLREYLQQYRPRLARYTTNILFVSKNGKKITKANLGDLVKKYVRKAGIAKAITPHSFRHTCATHLLKAGADIRYVQELLGHADLSATQIYTKVDISFLKKAHKQFHPRETDCNGLNQR